MVTAHNLGFPRIGRRRELKFALEKYWKKETSESDLQNVAQELRAKHWDYQKDLDLVPAGDFSFYDQVLDMSITVGNVPSRFAGEDVDDLTTFFRMARGRGVKDSDDSQFFACEMTKWFDTNYHFLVPEFNKDTEFKLYSQRLISQIKEAGNKAQKAVILGPVSYLYLGKSKDDSQRIDLLAKLLPVYQDLLKEISNAGIEWVQIDEPVLALDLEAEWQQAFKTAYASLADSPVKLLLTSYFGPLKENLSLATSLPVAGFHLDAVRGKEDVQALIDHAPQDAVISLGVIDGRNIWKTDLNAVLDFIEPIAQKLGDRLWIAPSCSLLHVPVDLDQEDQIDPEIKSWLAFALQKVEELTILKKALENGRDSVADFLNANQKALTSRRESVRVNNPAVKEALEQIQPNDDKRKSAFSERIKVQHEKLQLPLYPTTTIGSFPQTSEIRQARRDFKNGTITEAQYNDAMKAEIKDVIEKQEEMDIDVLVHGEAERNDMVEYFGEQLEGYVFSRFGWVQSYGSRCVKPPIIFGDISRPNPMTVSWASYAQSLSDRPVKGMLTGPVTILNWSFVRDDQPRSVTCKQIALAIRKEVTDLEKAGIGIIQIDEAALREGLPLRKSDWAEYLNWSVESFRLSTSDVEDTTQIHTHMCYSEFNDIIEAIAEMDADVITIETSRSDMELLNAFDDFEYPNDIGPGVYDIHSPNIPKVESIVKLMQIASDKIDPTRLWVNPDCGLKTRGWKEVSPALKNMVEATKILRDQHAQKVA